MDVAIVILLGSLIVLGLVVLLARWLGFRVLAEESTQRVAER